MSRGQPAQYRPEHATLLAKHLAEGGTLSAFAQLVGVNARTIRKWRKKYADFAKALGNEPTPPPTILTQARSVIISIGTWGVPKRTADDGLPRYSPFTEDEIDDRLWQGVAA